MENHRDTFQSFWAIFYGIYGLTILWISTNDYMGKYNFTVTEIIGPYGNKYPLLTANEYPWMNCQVIPLTSDRKDEIMEELKKRNEYVVYAEGRTDFCVIQAGGGTPEHPTIEITDDNWEEVDKALCDCMQAAADFWAEYRPK